MLEKVNSQSSSKDDSSRSLWIFGYGSLIWKPDFPFEYCAVGHIDGFVRRFYQGSTWHRGDSEKPGRVVTLVEEKQGRVWGIAYKVASVNANLALGKLNEREIALGGYDLHHLSFSCNEKPSHRFNVLAYVATPKNTLYLGPASPGQIALQIASAKGNSGLNVEYLVRLADFMREKVPDYDEQHLFDLEKLVKKELGLPTDVSTPWPQLKHNLISRG